MPKDKVQELTINNINFFFLKAIDAVFLKTGLHRIIQNACQRFRFVDPSPGSGLVGLKQEPGICL